jgi:lysophospholipase L1-like esterase
MRRSLLLLFTLFVSFPLWAVEAPPTAPAKATPTAAAATPTGPKRWEKDIAAFEQADREHPPKKHGILFIGSSSMVKWKTLAEDFPGFNVLNRGFGGSQIEDSVYYLERIVLPYEPRQVMFYAGGNDLNAKKTPEQVASDFQKFATGAHAKLPQTKIDYISIAPNFKRWSQIEQVRAANALIQKFCEANPEYLRFIDVHPVMLGADGQPLPDIYIADGLHMNAKGYAIWTKHLRPYLTPE